jgi:hypothetical protein
MKTRGWLFESQLAKLYVNKNVKVNFSTDYLKTFIASFFILSLSSPSKKFYCSFEISRRAKNAEIEISANLYRFKKLASVFRPL